MTERLARPWKRVIYIDPMASFAVENRARNARDAARYLGRSWSGEFILAVTFRDDAEYALFFAMLNRLMEASQGSAPNFLLVIDEVDLWSGPKYMDPSLSKILRYGRHYGCSWIANCRADVHTNRDVRMNAAEVLLFRQGMPSEEMKKLIADAEDLRETALPKLSKLTRHTEDGDAVEGEHFIATPEPFEDWLPTWEAIANA